MKSVCGKRVTCISITLLMLVFAVTATAAIPRPTGLVNDFAGVLDEATIQETTSLLQSLAMKVDLRMIVAVVETTGILAPDDYAEKVFRKWGVAEGEGDGVLLLIDAGDKRVCMVVDEATNKGCIIDERLQSFLDAGQYNIVLRIVVEDVAVQWGGDGLAGQNYLAGIPKQPGQKMALPWSTIALAFITMIVLIVIKVMKGEMDRQKPEIHHSFGSSGGEGFGGGFGGFRGGMSGHY